MLVTRWWRPGRRGMGSFVRKVGIGIIGCGNISSAYLTAARNFPVLDIRAVADLDLAAAQRRGEEFAVPAATIAELLADPAIEIVVNLTIPNAHVAVSHDILQAGKHSYSEKPLGVAFAEAAGLAEEAERRGLRLGCAPDTFLGGSHQTAREVLDGGRLGNSDRRNRLLHVPGTRALAPEPRLLLQDRRRAGARHGALLRHRSRQPARAGGAGGGDGAEATAAAHHHQRAALGRDDRGRGADARRAAVSNSSRARWLRSP